MPLTRRCIEVLQTVPQTYERVFPISATCLRLAWNRARNKAGINDLRFHDLRHEAVSRFFEMGMSVPEVALISGHKDVRAYKDLDSLKLFADENLDDGDLIIFLGAGDITQIARKFTEYLS